MPVIVRLEIALFALQSHPSLTCFMAIFYLLSSSSAIGMQTTRIFESGHQPLVCIAAIVCQLDLVDQFDIVTLGHEGTFSIMATVLFLSEKTPRISNLKSERKGLRESFNNLSESSSHSQMC